MNLTQLFCDVDDFCQTFVPAWEKSLLRQGEKKRNRPHLMSMSEMITIWVAYHQKGYRTFKWFYQQHVQKYWRREFPNLLSYNRFVELLPKVIVPLTAFMKSRSAASQGIAFIDSTSLCVCKNIRIPRHRTFAGRAPDSPDRQRSLDTAPRIRFCGESHQDVPGRHRGYYRFSGRETSSGPELACWPFQSTAPIQ